MPPLPRRRPNMAIRRRTVSEREAYIAGYKAGVAMTERWGAATAMETARLLGDINPSSSGVAGPANSYGPRRT